jgi:hypothetical protein
MAAAGCPRSDLADDDPRRHLSGEEAVDLLTARYGAGHGTVAKARELFETGILTPPKQAADPVAAIAPPPRDKAPVAAAAPAPVAKPAPGEIPGVRDLGGAALPSVGPKAVEPHTDEKPKPGKGGKRAKEKVEPKKPGRGAKDGPAAKDAGDPPSGFKDLLPASAPSGGETEVKSGDTT